MNPLDYVVSETERQSGTMREAVGMYQAYLFIPVATALTEADVLNAIESINGQTWYRQTPVYFRDGGHAANAQNIPRLMQNLIQYIGMLSADELRVEADALTKEFLDIHPFSDGNGRVGSLLWNLMRGSMVDPEPMPYFYGQSNG